MDRIREQEEEENERENAFERDPEQQQFMQNVLWVADNDGSYDDGTYDECVEQRLALDGNWYTEDEFYVFFQDNGKAWDEAADTYRYNADESVLESDEEVYPYLPSRLEQMQNQAIAQSIT